MSIRRPLAAYCAGLFLVLLASLTRATAQNESRSLTTLYNFHGAYGDGGGPVAGVLIGSGGLLFGIPTNGRAANDGTVFSLTPPSSTGGEWTETVLHSFVAGPTDGALPSSLVLGSGGVLYGSTEGGGDDAAIGCRGVFGCGIIFSLTPPPGGPTASAAMWNETVLYSFTGGSFPTGLAVRNGKGLFGTTGNLGSVGDGSVFSLVPTASSRGDWTETVLDSFQGKRWRPSQGGRGDRRGRRALWHVQRRRFGLRYGLFLAATRIWEAAGKCGCCIPSGVRTGPHPARFMARRFPAELRTWAPCSG